MNAPSRKKKGTAIAAPPPHSLFAQLLVFISAWIGLWLIIATARRPADLRVVYNASDSAPRGWYVVERTERLRVGDLALVSLRGVAAADAAQRGYLPRGVPLIKAVAATARQHVCVRLDGVRIDGQSAGALLHADALGRPLMPWHGCRHLQHGEVFLLGHHPASFDSRYLGPMAADQVIGRARSLGGWGSP